MHRSTGPPSRDDMLLIQHIYQRHKGILYQLAYSVTGSEMDADDAVSEAILYLFRRADRLRQLPEKALLSYAAKTVRSMATDIARRQRTEQRLFTSLDGAVFEPPDHAADPQARVLTEAEHALVRETLAELSDTDRLLLVGKYVYGCRDGILARQLGVKPSSIRPKLMRARKRARAIMERKEAEDGNAKDQRQGIRPAHA